MADRTGDQEGRPTVVLVGDEGPAADYGPPLRAQWDVDVVRGPEALPTLSAEPRVLVLDRDVSGIHADRILGIAREQGLDARVVMLTAVEPGRDPHRLGFDDYLVKPFDDAELVETVTCALRRAAYERELGRFYELAARRAERVAGGEAEAGGQGRLDAELAEAREAVRSAFERLDDDDVSILCSELSRWNEAFDAVPEP